MAEYPIIESKLYRKAPALEHWRVIDELREAHPFYWNSDGPGHWVLTRYDDIRDAFQDPARFSNHSIVATDPDPAYRFLPSHLDPPIHMEYRHLLNKWFAPAAVNRMRPHLVELARDAIAPLVEQGRCDYMDTVGDRFPVTAFLTAIGLPLDDADFFVSRVRRMSGALSDPTADKSGAMAAWADIAAYWRDVVAERRRAPRDPDVDLITHLSRSTVLGAPLPDDDLLDIAVTLTFGSLDTTKSQLGWCMYHLATHPGDRDRLVASPDLVPDAVEEFLRAYPIVSMARKVTADGEFRGCPMKQGDMVLLSIQSATRDPRVFPDADQVIIDRRPNRHIAFGASAHRCLGSHLARAELQIAIEEWHRLIPSYRFAAPEPPLARGGQTSVLALPLAWPAAP